MRHRSLLSSAAALATALALAAPMPPTRASHQVPAEFKILVDNGYGCPPSSQACRRVARVPYRRHVTQFDPTAGWDDGDRKGYRSAYTFLIDDSAGSGSEALGRVQTRSIVDPQNQGNAAIIKDWGMGECDRNWDGTVYTGPPECQELVNMHPPGDVTYTPVPLVNPLFNQRLPVITFCDSPLTGSSCQDQGNHIVEVRDYNGVILTSDPITDFVVVDDNPNFTGTFGSPTQQLCAPLTTCHRVTVVGYQDHPAGMGTMVPMVAIYYYDISPNVEMTSNFSELFINDVGVTEGQRGRVNATFVVTRSGNTDAAESVSWATADGTAVAPSDYTARSGTVSFAAGELAKIITVSVRSDTQVEPTETFFVNLSNATGARISDWQGVGTILDND